MPNQPRADNPARSVRIDDELWAAICWLAKHGGTTPSEIVRVALMRYLETP